jgi:hypothetical protein
VASDREPAALAAELRAAVARGGFPGFPLMDLSTMNERIDATRVGRRFQLLLIGGFGHGAAGRAPAGWPRGAHRSAHLAPVGRVREADRAGRSSAEK